VSFNAIKNHAIEILYSDGDSDLILKKLEALFLTNPTLYRENREVPTKKRSARLLRIHGMAGAVQSWYSVFLWLCFSYITTVFVMLFWRRELLLMYLIRCYYPIIPFDQHVARLFSKLRAD
jgi:hypothetical protein